MTPEEAYKILNGEIIYKGGRTNGKRFAMGELNRVINEALEKQIPKKPKESVVCEYCVDWMCPTCGSFHRTEWKTKCCSDCGQAIDWGE